MVDQATVSKLSVRFDLLLIPSEGLPLQPITRHSAAFVKCHIFQQPGN